MVTFFFFPIKEPCCVMPSPPLLYPTIVCRTYNWRRPRNGVVRVGCVGSFDNGNAQNGLHTHIVQPVERRHASYLKGLVKLRSGLSTSKLLILIYCIPFVVHGHVREEAEFSKLLPQSPMAKIVQNVFNVRRLSHKTGHTHFNSLSTKAYDWLSGIRQVLSSCQLPNPDLSAALPDTEPCFVTLESISSLLLCLFFTQF